MPRVVTLSTNQKIEVGQLRWGGYRKVRDALLTEALPQIGRLVTDAMGTPGLVESIQVFLDPDESLDNAERTRRAADAMLPGLAAGGLSDLIERCGNAVFGLLASSDRVAEALVDGSCADGVHCNALSVHDVMALREAALAENDLSQMLDAEKNWLAALGKSAGKSLGIGQSSSPAGTSAGSQPSPQATGGPAT